MFFILKSDLEGKILLMTICKGHGSQQEISQLVKMENHDGLVDRYFFLSRCSALPMVLIKLRTTVNLEVHQ